MLKDFINRIFDFVLSSLKFLERIKVSKYRKYLNTTLLFAGAIFLFFFSYNAYAYNSYSGIDTESLPRIDTNKVWEVETEKCKTLSVSDGINIQCLVNNLLNSISINIINMISPEITESGYAMINDPNVDPSAKVSLLSLTDSAVSISMRTQPNVDVVAYLQSEWVPGYTSSTSVYAASGYDFLKDNGIIQFYNIFQTVSYVIFVLVLVVTGFMIMFRQKLGGQTAVTVMNTLPNVLIGLVLITFCFSIVGILLNIGALLTNMVVTLYGFESVDNGILMETPVGTPAQLMSALTRSGGGEGISSGAISWVLPLLQGILVYVPVVQVFNFIVIAIEVVIIAGGIKVFVTLIKSYLSIIINTVTGPLQITFGTFPGNTKFLQNWFFSTIKAVLAFPLVYAIVNIPILIMNTPSVKLHFNGLVDGTLATTGQGVDLAEISASIVMIGVFIASIYFAADAPKLLNDIFPTESGKGLQEAIGGTRGNLSKIPLIGGMFGK